MNGEPRLFPDLNAGATLADLISSLELKGDRIAVEHNGAIIQRKDWSTHPVAENDRLEVVHFVGGGTESAPSSCARASPGHRVRSAPSPTLDMVILRTAARRQGMKTRAAALFLPAFIVFGTTIVNAQDPAAPQVRSYASASINQLDPAHPSAPMGQPTIVVNEIRPGSDLKIVAYGDSRFTDPADDTDASPRPRKWLVDRIAKEAPDAIFFSGDMPFMGDDPADWQVFQHETEPWRAAHLRLYPAIGNHELARDPMRGLQNYFANFPYLHEHRWYSVQLGNVYLIVLDSFWAPVPGTAQRQWLESQLANLPATADFVFFLSHMPLVTDIQTQMAVSLPTPDQIELRNYIEGQSQHSHAKFVVVNGHIHNYERYERKGVSYIVTGGGGAKPYPVMVRANDDLYQQPGFPNFHYLVIEVHGKHAKVTMNRIIDPQAELLKSEVRETFTLDAKE
ncbi:MAG TPA: sulfur carrier protein ThiS [Acidisarcina sp.]